ncbi:MAG TPA: NfeD family protein [Bacteroidales bacterium]|jgi:membrane protein implicated in regulation of membrane protease activity|nr:NfeD family protein [Bacteroidales bacterium]
MEIKNIILIGIIGFIVFEVIEHIGIPIVFYFMKRKKKSVTGIESLLGEVVTVGQWKETEGQVFIKGEPWRAVSDIPLIKGEKAIIHNIEGLTLKVKPVGESVDHK